VVPFVECSCAVVRQNLIPSVTLYVSVINKAFMLVLYFTHMGLLQKIVTVLYERRQ